MQPLLSTMMDSQFALSSFRHSDLFLFLLSLFSASLLLSSRWPRTRYPPGPRGPPFLGVARQRPTSEAWKTYARWGREFGDEGILSFQMFGRRMVVINSHPVAEELLAHRGAIYSDRPFPTMSGRLMRRDKSIFLMPYNARLKTYRRLMHRNFNSRAMQNYWPLQEQATHVFLGDLLRAPELLYSHLRRVAGTIILKIAYGYTVQPGHDRFIALADETMRVGSLAAVPGKWLVDSFPILRFIPSWFPGAGFKRQAKAWGQQLYMQSLEPHNYVKQEMAAGRAIPSFTSQLLNPDETCAEDEREDIVFWTAGGLYAGAADTTASAMHTFFFVLVLHPEIQTRGQAEVDAVIGPDRLPTFADVRSLPYVGCIIKEVLRWLPPAPLALPRTTSTHDVYRGYTIPKGSFVISNLWAMLHDPKEYPDPMTFDPSRYEGPQPQPDPRDLAFGRGRRKCPGQHIAEASLFIQVACVLAVLDVRCMLDEKGQRIEPELETTSEIVSHIKPFKCSIIPRSARARALVEQAIVLDDS